jgi:nicotinate-nucleotide pyrophosphorylase (carboxylating)
MILNDLPLSYPEEDRENIMKVEAIDAIVDVALREDMPDGDVTSDNVIPTDSVSRAVLLAKQQGILVGLPVAQRVFEALDPDVSFDALRSDGEGIDPGDRLAVVAGNTIALLKGERTALNFMQRLSGIATLTRRYVEALEGTETRLLDTRKTTPGLRMLEKYAVKMGGGENHRLNLSDMVMLKDNHIRLVGSIAEAVRRARSSIDPAIKIEVETTTLAEVREAVESGADMIMLDNMILETIKESVDWVDGRVPLEVSGNVDLEGIRRIARLGVDFISVGRLTHSFHSLDISMDFV